MTGSYQRPAGENEPITAQWSPGQYHDGTVPYQVPGPPRDQHYYQPGGPPADAYYQPASGPPADAYYRPGAGPPDAYYQPGGPQADPRYPYYPQPGMPHEAPWPPQPPAGGGAGWGGWPPYGGYWPPQPAPPPRRRGLIGGLVVLLALLMVAAVGVAVGVGRALHNSASNSPVTGGQDNGGTQNNGGTQPVPGTTTAPRNTLDSSSIAAKVDKWVVDINTVLKYENGRAAGTGVVVGSSGLVLTNNHVVAGATSITVTEVTTGRTYQASVVGYDRSEDIAVVQMKNASGLPTAMIGDSEKVGVGDPVIAIGNAGGTGGTPSVAPGTVSALNQSITASDESTGSSEQLIGLIQVEANIQPGDSGGPLVNGSGQVIGIDTAASVGGGFHYQANGGTGFAIPINQAMTIGSQISAGQASSKIHIGATGFLGVDVHASQNGTGGASLDGVVAGSPAEAAGLTNGDVITSINGQPVSSATALTQLLDGYHPGDRVRVGWTDPNGRAHTSTIKLMTGPVG